MTVKIKNIMSYFFKFFQNVFILLIYHLFILVKIVIFVMFWVKKFKSRLIFVNKSLLCGFFTSLFHQWLLICVFFSFEILAFVQVDLVFSLKILIMSHTLFWLTIRVQWDERLYKANETIEKEVFSGRKIEIKRERKPKRKKGLKTS